LRRLALALIAVVLPQVAAAQIGSLVKKVKDKVGSSHTTTATPTGKVSVVVTSDIVDRFITGFRAERAERDRLAAQHTNDGVGKMYAARDLVTRCDSMKHADSVYSADLMRRVRTADQKAVQEMQKWVMTTPSEPLHVQCQHNKAPQASDQSFFDMVRSVQARQDTVGAKAGGFTVTDYGAIREKIAAYVLWPASASPRDWPGYTAEERAAIDAKKVVLVELLKRDFSVSGMPKMTSEL
jgi:hypothetical protein